MPSEAHHNHVLIIEDDKGRHEFTLDAPLYSIGRDPKCDIRLVSQFVSRRHATIVQLPNDDGTYYYRIVDGNLKGKPSANGLLINGRKLQAHDLENGDEIVFGPNVSAVYYLLKRAAFKTQPPDEFDITLISPNMVDPPEDEDDDQFDDHSPSGPPTDRGHPFPQNTSSTEAKGDDDDDEETAIPNS